MTPDTVNFNNVNIYMLAVMFFLLVLTTYVGPGQGSRTLLMLCAAGFIGWMALGSGVIWLALVMAFVCGVFAYHLVRLMITNIFGDR